MYFKDRSQAGKLLADRMSQYKDDTVVILALTSGAVLLGQPIAERLGAELTLLLSRDIKIPGEESVIGTVDQAGGFTYNNMFSVGELEELVTEFHNNIEADKLNVLSDINQSTGSFGLQDRHALKDKVVIVLSDGVKQGVAFDAALNYLKPVRLKKILAATPIASVPAVDRMHILADEIYVLSVIDNYLDTDHYYEINEVPTNETVLKLLTPIKPISAVARKSGRNYT